jgi:rhamnosyltransferase
VVTGSPNARPRVAVLLATYNGERWLGEQLASLAGQEGVDVEVFFADDGSRDATVEVVRASSALGLVTHQISGRRAGTAARNFARLLAEADIHGFDFVAFSDQDDVWLPNKLARAIECLREADAAGYASNMTAVFPSSRPVLLRKDFPLRRFDYLFQSASAACTCVFTAAAASTIRDVVGTSFWEWSDDVSFDCVVYAAIRSRGLRWVIDSEASILYRQHDSNVFGANVGWRAVRRRIRLLRDGWLRAHVRSLRPYCASSAAALEVIGRVERGRWPDRLWLAARTSQFRREPRERFALRMFFLLGWF